MINLIDHLTKAIQHAMSIRPQVGGFPVLAEVLRQAGVLNNRWSLPSCQSIYIMKNGSVIQQGTPLVSGFHEVPHFDREALIGALRKDQAGLSSFPEFLESTWKAGVTSYEVDFTARKVTYYGANGESYCEEYAKAQVK